MDDGYRAVRAVIYRDIASVVVCVALLAAVVYVGSMRPQQWQLRTLGVPAGTMRSISTMHIYSDGFSLTVVPKDAIRAVAKAHMTTERTSYGYIRMPRGDYEVTEYLDSVSTRFTILDGNVSEQELSEFMRNDSLARAYQRLPPSGTSFSFPYALQSPPRLGWVIWKYAQIPFWSGVAILAFILWLLRPRLPGMMYRAHRGRCWKCGYDLGNTRATCPECNATPWTSRLITSRRVPLPHSSPP